MWVWFVADYFLFERVQLYTFDIIEEGVGFKLIIGCVVVYPCLFPVVLWGTAGLPRRTSTRNSTSCGLAVQRPCSSSAG